MLNDDRIKKLVSVIRQYRNGRKVVFLSNHDEMRKAFENYGITIEKVFTGNHDLIASDDQYVPTSQLNGNSDQYYVIVPFVFDPQGSIHKKILAAYGYEILKDYMFYMEQKIIKPETTGLYEDCHENKITGANEKIQFLVSGVKNQITIHGSQKIDGELKIVCEGNYNQIVIGEGCQFSGKNIIVMRGEYHSSIIGGSCSFFQNAIRFGPPASSSLVIGDQSTFNTNTQINMCSCSNVRIGKDCMLSTEVAIHTGDSHTIFDLHSGKNINSDLSQRGDDGYLYHLELEDHVWIGQRATLLAGLGRKGTKVRRGSIVGALSLVKGHFPNNVILAGVPAKVKKKDIAWARKNMSEDISYCMGYTDFTEEAE